MFRPALATALAALLGLGCAAGPPSGGARMAQAARYRPFGPPATRRSPPKPPAQRAPAPTASPDRNRAVALAQSLVGKPHVVLNGKPYPDDCAGLVLGVYGQLGLDLGKAGREGDNSVSALYRFAQRHGQVFSRGVPSPGDLVFFRDTYDSNRDGRVNDGLTHVGLVETTQPDGTVLVIHRVKRGIVRYRMNLENPKERLHPESGVAINDYLRTPSAGRRSYLTAELFAAYGSVLSAAPVVAHR